MTADNRERPPPNIKGAAEQMPSQSRQAMTLDGNRAIQASIECRPSIVPFNCGGAASTMKVRSAPAVIAV